MKKYKVELTEEQLVELKVFLGIEWGDWDGFSTEVQKTTLEAIQAAEVIPEKVWLPFITLKDGGTYLTRDGREFKVCRRNMSGLTYPFGCVGSTYTWTISGNYTVVKVEDEFDLILELQPSEEQTTGK